jgi:hypothetical protein
MMYYLLSFNEKFAHMHAHTHVCVHACTFQFTFHVSALSVCSDLQPTTDKLFFHVCRACLGPTDLENTLKAIFTDGIVENITVETMGLGRQGVD